MKETDKNAYAIHIDNYWYSRNTLKRVKVTDFFNSVTNFFKSCRHDYLTEKAQRKAVTDELSMHITNAKTTEDSKKIISFIDNNSKRFKPSFFNDHISLQKTWKIIRDGIANSLNETPSDVVNNKK